MAVGSEEAAKEAEGSEVSGSEAADWAAAVPDTSLESGIQQILQSKTRDSCIFQPRKSTDSLSMG